MSHLGNMDERDDMDDMDEFQSRAGSDTNDSHGGLVRGEDPPAQDEDDATRPKDAKMWAKQGPNFFPCDEAIDKLIPGQYEVAVSPQSGVYFQQKSTEFDELMRLPDSASDRVYENIETFWTKEAHFRSFGFLWKRGILLWGPAGSGKTSTLQLVSQSIVKKGGIAVYVENPEITAKGLAILRRIEPKRPVVVMLEDLDAMIGTHGEHAVLALLDGELQIDNVVFIATTNYPERLDKRVVNRPSRFDLVEKVGMPKPDARRMYLAAKNKRLVDATVPCDCNAGRVESNSSCKTCKGTGSLQIVLVCEACRGEGYLEQPAESGTSEDTVKVPCACDKGNVTEQHPCQNCKETGKMAVTIDCGKCEGKGHTKELDRWIKDTDQFSVAHMKELIVSVEVFEVPFASAVKRLRKMVNYHPKSTDADEDTPAGDYR